MPNDVLVELDQTGKPAKRGDGVLAVAITDEQRRAHWAEVAAMFPDPRPVRRVPVGSRLHGLLVSAFPGLRVYRYGVAGADPYVVASPRQCWEADLLASNWFTATEWHDIVDAWTDSKHARALSHEKNGRLDLSFDEVIEQSGLRHALGGDERGDIARVDCWRWSNSEKRRFFPVYMSNVDHARLRRMPGDSRPPVRVRLDQVGLDEKTMGELRDPNFVFHPRRNYIEDFSALVVEGA